MQDKTKNITGIEMQILENPREDVQFHPEIEIIYVMEGEVRVTVKDIPYTLEKGGIILVNSAISYQISSKKAIICAFHLSYQTLTHIIKDEYFTFICNTATDTIRPYSKLREILNQIIYNSLENQHETNCLAYSLEYQMLDCLIENFQIKNTKDKKEVVKDSSQRLQMMINYVNMNYQHQISLNELANRMFLSTSSLSRFFRKETGIYFAEFVTDVRLHYAVSDLIYTGETITKIAVDNGFSNPSVFSKVFQERYHMSPSNYRKEMKLEENAVNEAKEDVKEKLKSQLQKIHMFAPILENIHTVDIKSDVQDSHAYEPFWNKVINIGSAYSLTLANLQYHTLFLAEHLNFTHVRIWNIFSERMKISKGFGDQRFNFDNLDTVLEFLVNNGIKPFLDFGMRPECAVKTEKEMVYFEQDHMEFQSLGEWESMVRSFMRHIVKRFGSAETGEWIFEYSLDVDHMASHTENGESLFFIKYQKFYKMVKEVLPDTIICGPSIIIDSNEQLFNEFLTDCRENKCIPDYISMLLFPYQSVSDASKNQFAQRIWDLNFMTGQIAVVKKIMKECEITTSKLCISEWNSSLSNRNYLNDSCFRAAYIMKMISVMWDKVDMACFWMGSDWISAYYDSGMVLHGGVGLITKDGIRKPAFYAVNFLNYLGKYCVAYGNHYIITSNGRNSYWIACFNFKWYSSNYYIKGENELDINSLSTYFENNDSVCLKFQLKNMETDKKYTLKKQLVNDEYGSILQEWMRFNCEEDLEGSDVKYLRDICTPHLSMEKKMAVRDTLEFETQLRAHEVALIHIYQDY